ncbi:MAG: hypothetical protein HC889_07970, partial [Synechococcaceae cyanobacterium SM1_2_3]|nr:hypothetical protein [Synechococcaceae cyanobacterium SM1_2_3]
MNALRPLSLPKRQDERMERKFCPFLHTIGKAILWIKRRSLNPEISRYILDASLMNDGLLLSRTPGCIPLIPVNENGFNDWLQQQDDALRRWLTATSFKAKAGSFSLIPSADGLLRTVIVVIANADDLWALGALPVSLPEGDYFVDALFEPRQLERLALGWALGGYQFSRYKIPKRSSARLALD